MHSDRAIRSLREGSRRARSEGRVWRAFVAWLAVVFGTLIAGIPAAPARADVNSFLAGMNGLLTFPADPVMDAISPSPQIKGLPGKYTENAVGFAGGIFYGIYRAWVGAADIALAPFWIFPTLSPPPHWDLVPFYEVEYP
jgi:hypothetical protein